MWGGAVNSLVFSPASAEQVLTVRGEQELFARAGHLFEAHEEFVCAATDLSTWNIPGQRKAIAARVAEHTAAGIAVYKLFTPKAVAVRNDSLHLAEINRQGVRVRIYPGQLAHETIIIDRRVAILAGPAGAGPRSFSVVRAPDVVAAVRALYQATWESATDLTDALATTPPAVDEEGLGILRLLGAGRKDESAARELGMSVRTYRRRVADLMVLLGADSRFQAGVRARTLGLPV
jgi:DNA-binding NarL/FixJ family response regulator